MLTIGINCGPRGGTRGGTRLRGPEVLGPLRGLGIRPLVSVIRGLGNHFPGAPKSPRKALRGPGEALQGPRRGVFVFNGPGKQGGPLTGPKRSCFPGCPLRGFQPSGSYPWATDNGSFLLTVELFYLQLTILASLLTVGASSLTFLAFYLRLELFAYSRKVRLISALKRCKRKSSNCKQESFPKNFQGHFPLRKK